VAGQHEPPPAAADATDDHRQHGPLRLLAGPCRICTDGGEVRRQQLGRESETGQPKRGVIGGRHLRAGHARDSDELDELALDRLGVYCVGDPPRLRVQSPTLAPNLHWARIETALTCPDYCSGRIWAIRADAGSPATPTLMLDTSLNVSSFGQDDGGEVYVVDHNGGTIYRIIARRRPNIP
jgi:hypothetical protein